MAGAAESDRHIGTGVDSGSFFKSDSKNCARQKDSSFRQRNDEADAETENRAAHEHHGLRVCGTVFEASRITWCEVGEKFDKREGEARDLDVAAAK